MVKSQAAGREAEPFRSLVLRYRGRTGLTQRDLAARMGSSRRTVQDWESGVNYPTADRLQALIFGVARGACPDRWAREGGS
jgi:DNA-binding transcriptional regulator YiaG